MGLKPPTDQKELKAFEKKYKKGFDTEKEKFLTQKDSSFVKNFLSGKKKSLATEAKIKDRKTEQAALLETTAGVQKMAGEIFRKIPEKKRNKIIEAKQDLFKSDEEVNKHIKKQYGHEFAGLKGTAREEAIKKKAENFKKLRNEGSDEFLKQATTKEDFKSTALTGLSAEFSKASGKDAKSSRLPSGWFKRRAAGKKLKKSVAALSSSPEVGKELQRRKLQKEQEKVRQNDIKKVKSAKLMTDPEYLKLTTNSQRERYKKDKKREEIISGKDILGQDLLANVEKSSNEKFEDKIKKKAKENAPKQFEEYELEKKKGEIEKDVEEAKNKYLEAKLKPMDDNAKKKFEESFRDNSDSVLTDTEKAELEAITTKVRNTKKGEFNKISDNSYEEFAKRKKKTFITEQTRKNKKNKKSKKEAERLYEDQLKKTTQEKIMEGTFKENYENLDIKTQNSLKVAINLGPSGYKDFLRKLPNQSDRGLIEMAKLELNDADKNRSVNGSYKKTRSGFQTSLAKKKTQMLRNNEKRNESKMEAMRQVKAKRNSNLKKLENSDKFKAMTKNEQEKEREKKTNEYTKKYSKELEEVTSKLYENQSLNMIESKDKRRSKLSRLGRFIPGSSSKATKQMQEIARARGASVTPKLFRKMRGKDTAKYYKKKIEKEEAFVKNLLEQTGDDKNETKQKKFNMLYEKAKKQQFSEDKCIKDHNLSPETCDYLKGVSKTKEGSVWTETHYTKWKLNPFGKTKGHSKTKKNVKYRLKKKQKLKKYFDKALPFIKRECKDNNNFGFKTLEECVEDKRKDMEKLNTKQTWYQKYGPGTSNYRRQKRELKKKSVIGRELNKGTEINNTTFYKLTHNIKNQDSKLRRAKNVVWGQKSIKTRLINRISLREKEKKKITNELNELIDTIINNMKSIFNKEYKKEKVIEISNKFLSGLIDYNGLDAKIKDILNYKGNGSNDDKSIKSIITNIKYSKQGIMGS